MNNKKEIEIQKICWSECRKEFFRSELELTFPIEIKIGDWVESYRLKVVLTFNVYHKTFEGIHILRNKRANISFKNFLEVLKLLSENFGKIKKWVKTIDNEIVFDKTVFLQDIFNIEKSDEIKTEADERIIEIIIETNFQKFDIYYLFDIVIDGGDINPINISKGLTKTNIYFQKFNQTKEFSISNFEKEILISYLFLNKNKLKEKLNKLNFKSKYFFKTIFTKLKDEKEYLKQLSLNKKRKNSKEKIELEEINNYNKWLIMYFSNTNETHQKTILADDEQEVKKYLYDLIADGVKKEEIKVYSPKGEIFKIKLSKKEKIQQILSNLNKIECDQNSLNKTQTNYLDKVYNDLLRLKKEITMK